MRAANVPQYRVTMRQPPRADDTCAAPRNFCVIQRAIQGATDGNQLWDSWRHRWLETWGWSKVPAEHSMSWIATTTGIARREVDNDDVLVTTPDNDTIEALSRLLVDTRKIVTKKLPLETPLETTSRVAEKTSQIPKSSGVITWPFKKQRDRAVIT